MSRAFVFFLQFLDYLDIDLEKNKLHGLILLQKAVLKLDLHDEKAKKKAMKRVSSIPGIHFFVLSIIACKSRSSMKYL